MDADEACLKVLFSRYTRRLRTLRESRLPASNGRLFPFKYQAINITHRFKIFKSGIERKRLADNIIIRVGKFARFCYEF